MRILFIGDIVGRSGRHVLLDRMPKLIAEWKLDLVVVNGENAAGGFGITEAIYNEMIDAGADAVTLGNHAWDQREALVFIERAPRLIRPVNYPPGTPGRGAALVEAKNGAHALVSTPWAASSWTRSTIRSPRSTASSQLVALKTAADAIIVDMHCEATSEKQAMGYFCDGRASLVVGTHTHCADRGPPHPAGRHGLHVRRRHDRRLPVGDRHGQGRAAHPFHAEDFLEQVRGGERPRRRCPALAVETDDATGLATRVGPVRLGGVLEEARPPFWAEDAMRLRVSAVCNAPSSVFACSLARVCLIVFFYTFVKPSPA